VTGCHHDERVIAIRTAHTADLDPASLAGARALLYAVFDDMTESDWEHSLGGIHALAWDGPDLVGHAAVIQRRILHGGVALRTGYIEGVGVRSDRRRKGIGAALMEPLEDVIRKAYDIGALAATDEALPFYASRGWQPWNGPAFALTPGGVVRTADADDCIFVLPNRTQLDTSGELTCDWRDGDAW